MELVPLDALWMSWTLQTTIGVILLIALWGIRRLFKEAAIGAVARGWLAYVAAMIASLVAVAADRAHASAAVHVTVDAIEGVARVTMFLEWYPLAAVLAGDPVARRTTGVRVMHVLLATAYAATDVLLETWAPWAHLNVMEHVYPCAFAWLSIAALRTSRRAERNANVVRWLAFGYLLFFLRGESINWIFGDSYVPPSLRAFVAISVIQIAQVAAFGVVCLVVALTLERAAIVEQAARLREAEARLMNARRLASLGEMAARVAHDFNNVLMVVMTGVDFARTKLPRDSTANERLADVSLAATEARALIAQLLAFGRPISGDPKGCDVRSFFADRDRNFAMLAGSTATVEITPPAEGTRVAIDAATLEQVLYNLVTNARDAMPNGGAIRIEAAVTTLDRPRAVQEGELPAGKYVRIGVEDEGSGIQPEVRSKIFEPFFTTKGSGGTGLGLATVYAIVTQAKGDVAVTTEVGNGARFDVFLPLA